MCLNDEVTEMTPPLREALRVFYEGLFPVPSQFEKGRWTSEGKEKRVVWFGWWIVAAVIGVVMVWFCVA